MVKMRPSSYPTNTVKGEKLVFDFLSGLPDTENWIGLHSLDIFGDIPHGQGEADMVVLIPGKGILVIEVKTHSTVECIDGDWFLNGKKKDKSPHKQASNSMFALIEDLKNAGADLYKMPVAFCVWFTGSTKIALPRSKEYKPWMFLFSQDLSGDGKKTLMNIMDQWADMRELQRGNPQNSVATQENIKKIANLLRPDVKITKTAEQRLQEVNDSLALALEHQLELMHLISGRKQVSIIPGIAGTGKTHIAIAEAKRAHQRGDRTLFVCYNALLSKYLTSELAGYSLVEVHTMSEFMLKVAGKTFKDATNSSWWHTELPSIAQEAIVEAKAFDSFDALIVDEAQDLSLPAYLDVLDLALAKGFENSQVMFFGDFTHQAVYVPGDVAMRNLLEKIPSAIDYQMLSINCRNTKQIGETVMQILKETGGYSSYRRKDDGVMPTLISLKQGESAVRHVRDHVNRLAKTYSLDQVVVLSSSKVKLEVLVHEVGLPATSLDFPLPGKFRWGTSQAFKGMESPAVILVEFEDAGAATRETFYVAGTRAISELVCVVPLSVMQKISQS